MKNHKNSYGFKGNLMMAQEFMDNIWVRANPDKIEQAQNMLWDRSMPCSPQDKVRDGKRYCITRWATI